MFSNHNRPLFDTLRGSIGHTPGQVVVASSEQGQVSTTGAESGAALPVGEVSS